MTDTNHIRPIVIAVIEHNESILVFEGHYKSTGEIFYRPLGGGIDFGEHSRDALLREFREELDAEIIISQYLGTLENIFVADNRGGHEIVQVYRADFVDPALYTLPEMTGVEDDGSTFRVRWMPLAYFETGDRPLYPNGLLELLKSTL
jgi:8-oxo-dGTP pyrophosphatase MutT (NUDIX family)